MSRKSKFTWNASSAEAFQKTVRNFNAKIRYQRKAHPEIADLLPESIKGERRKELLEILNDPYTTKQDFERKMKSLQRFSQKDATKVMVDIEGNPILNWEKKEIQYKVTAVNQKLKKQREALAQNKPLVKKGDIEYNELEEIKLEELQNIKWDKFAKALDKKLMQRFEDRSAELYKQKYLEKIQENMHSAGDEFYNFISRVPAKVLWEARFQEDKSLKIQFTSDPVPSDELAQMSLDKWRDYLGLEEGETYEDLDADI